MNTNLATRTTIRSTALAACLAMLFAGATACGTENGKTNTPADQPQPAREYYHGQYHDQDQDQGFPFDAIERAKAHAAQQAARQRSHHLGDDKRHARGHSDPLTQSNSLAHPGDWLARRPPADW
jgi:hypothetical protein